LNFEHEKTEVFCIGFHKTGTTSFELALKKLGNRVTGSFGTKDPDMLKMKQRRRIYYSSEQ
jgi:hypothetical protein